MRAIQVVWRVHSMAALRQLLADRAEPKASRRGRSGANGHSPTFRITVRWML
jgi:hypothetical protein